ncbi:MAG: sensor domain-containing diguanylate cyclase [Nitrospira sp.]|nr:sensor domain-containing diguanylate cyclase [Candidatus Manganitrophaceae bacterium]HIL34119.1 sensor domain-containing diguanylate cyclase [Candidatus Manganitrophaceae bacterium]
MKKIKTENERKPARKGSDLSHLRKENTRLKQELRRRTKELSSFIVFGKALSSVLEFEKVLRVIMDTARKILRCESWSLILVDESKKELYFKMVKGPTMKVAKKLRYKMGEGPAGWVAEQGKPLLISDFSSQWQFQPKEFYPHVGARTALCLPIISKKKVIGVIQMVNRADETPFDENDLSLLSKLGDQATLAIERSDLYKKMADLASTDDLTHLYNIRYLDHILDLEIKRCRRYSIRLSLIFLDMDFFKLVNDQHGHLMGSQVLVEVANILNNSLREIDIVARYGGDEFVVVLPETSVEIAGRIARRIRNAIHSYEFLKKEGLSLHLTASFGIAGFPDQAKNKTDLVCLADQAMYRAKVMGRDKIFLA